MAVPGNVIYFAGYDALRFNTHSPVYQRVPDNYAPLVAGSIARVAAAAVVSPVEMFRTRMQATASSGKEGRGVFRETLKGLGQLAQTQGYSSLWRGLTLTMWRDVPFSGVYWWGYEAVRTRLRELRHSRAVDQLLHVAHEDHTSTFIDSFLAGATSGAVASVVTTPFDVGKTRQQVWEREHAEDLSKKHANMSSASSQSHMRGKAALAPEEMTMPRFLYHIWRDEGTAGLFRGWAARTLKVAPACAIMISSYEMGKKMAIRMNERKRVEAAEGAI